MSTTSDDGSADRRHLTVFARQCKAAYLTVKATTSESLQSKEELLFALQQVGRDPTDRFTRAQWTKYGGTGTYIEIASSHPAFPLDLHFRHDHLRSVLSPCAPTAEASLGSPAGV